VGRVHRAQLDTVLVGRERRPMVGRAPHPGPLPIGSADSADAEREKRSRRQAVEPLNRRSERRPVAGLAGSGCGGCSASIWPARVISRRKPAECRRSGSGGGGQWFPAQIPSPRALHIILTGPRRQLTAARACRAPSFSAPTRRGRHHRDWREWVGRCQHRARCRNRRTCWCRLQSSC